MNKSIAVVFLLCGTLCNTFGQAVLHGTIVDEETAEPVPFASISISNSTVGTACNEHGEFVMRVSSVLLHEGLVISCLGYHNRHVAIDSLNRIQQPVKIALRPYTHYLDDVTISASRPKPEELLEEALSAIPRNFSQAPFNLEFYSKIEVYDSASVQYQLETILKTYRAGYLRNAYNQSVIVEKRERGTCPLPPVRDKKTGAEHIPLSPAFVIFHIDQVGGTLYSVFNPKQRKRMEFAYLDESIFDGDTVVAIAYSFRKKDLKDASADPEGQYNGVLYIAVNNLAIVRHTLQIGNIREDIIYKRSGDHYFPYLIRSQRPAYGSARYQVEQLVTLRNIGLDSVGIVNRNIQGTQRVEDVSFRPAYWAAMYPVSGR